MDIRIWSLFIEIWVWFAVIVLLFTGILMIAKPPFHGLAEKRGARWVAGPIAMLSAIFILALYFGIIK
jgi:uncharacterized membrane protein